MQMSWLGQQKMEEVNRKDRTNMNYIKSRNNQGVRQTVYACLFTSAKPPHIAPPARPPDRK